MDATHIQVRGISQGKRTCQRPKGLQMHPAGQARDRDRNPLNSKVGEVGRGCSVLTRRWGSCVGREEGDRPGVEIAKKAFLHDFLHLVAQRTKHFLSMRVLHNRRHATQCCMDACMHFPLGRCRSHSNGQVHRCSLQHVHGKMFHVSSCMLVWSRTVYKQDDSEDVPGRGREGVLVLGTCTRIHARTLV